ncbi:Long-chain-fatty-acid--CoA ligase (EC [Olavius sp. associated proteobacterium Delta 1]|nr:Long-chain-fatty-acid--CoA ligase (EC [Olavius sp. associated proteobacterium Delta 1]
MTGESLGDCFSETFLAREEKPAMTFLRDGRVETEISYLELERDKNRMANVFQHLGVEKGDRVILFIPKSLIFVVAHLALQKIGAIAVPLNPGFKKSELEYLFQDAAAKIILSEPGRETLIKELDSNLINLIIDTQKPYQDIEVFHKATEDFSPVEISPDDPGLIIYTSGTTGKPKGAVLTQKNLIHDARNIINIWEISESDVLCHALPLFHVHGLCFALHTALLAGAHVIMLDLFSPQRIIETLSRKKGPGVCTMFMAVPAMYGKLMAYLGGKRPDFKQMRLWTSGSAPLLAADFVRIHRIFGKQPVEREGMSETGMNFSNPLHGIKKPGSIGIPLPGLEVRTVDPATGLDVAPGQTGEFWLKGPAITPGYWRKPDETANTFEQGWFKTGDLGNVDEDGYYYLTDRIKHIIISGGENISPKEVEAVINQVEGVAESSVVGVQDEKWGEKIVAALVTKPGAEISLTEIQSHCKAHLHDWKCPKVIKFVKKLPRNTMGKVLKEEVKKHF